MRHSLLTVYVSLISCFFPLLAFDLDSEIDKIKSGAEYSVSEGGYYAKIGSSSQWVLYLPSADQLMYHTSGQNDITSLSTSDFSSITASGTSIVFGTYSGSDSQGNSLSDSTYKLDGDNAGYYINYDTTEQMWFYYTPAVDYLYIHKSGEATDGQGLYLSSRNDLEMYLTETPFGTILTVASDGNCYDPFGNIIDCAGDSSSTQSSSATSQASTAQSTSSTIGGECGWNQVYDCNMECVDASYAHHYQGDGVCDDGGWGFFLNCSAFNNDGGDCEGSNDNGSGSNSSGYYGDYTSYCDQSTGMMMQCDFYGSCYSTGEACSGSGYTSSSGNSDCYQQYQGYEHCCVYYDSLYETNGEFSQCIIDSVNSSYSNSSASSTDGEYQTIAGIKFLAEEPDGHFGWEDAMEWCEDRGGRLPTKSELLAVWNSNGGEPSPYGFQKDTFYWALEEADCGYDSDVGCHHACAMDAWCSEDANWPDDSYGHPKCVMGDSTSTSTTPSDSTTTSCSGFTVGEPSIYMTVGNSYWINVSNYCDSLSISSDDSEIATAQWYIHDNGWTELQVDAHHNGTTTIKINDASGYSVASVTVNASWSSTTNY